MSGDGTDRYEYGPARRVVLSPGVERLVRAAAEVPRCATCRHWEKYPALGFGRCQRIDSDSTVAWVEFHNAHQLTTQPDFGCTLHEPGRPPTEETEP